MADGRHLALRFLAGRLEGGVVPVDPGCQLLVGRQPGADVLLAEDLVSRRHACISRSGDEVVLEDLGSTNGTFLNGVRVQRARIVEGDRVLVGESVFTLAALDPARRADATEVRTLIERAIVTAERRPASAIQGRIDEVRLHDLLQLLSTARKSGVLAIRRDGHTAEVRLERGHVVCATLDLREDMSPYKVLFRLFDWTSGQFELRPGPDETGAKPVAHSTDALLMEVARHMDEMKRLRGALPDRFAPGTAPAEQLDEDDRELLDLATSLGELDAVLDATPLPDVIAVQRLAALCARGVVAPSQAGGGPVDARRDGAR